MRIGELSERSGVSPRSLRYYEQQGLLASERMPNGYREYAHAAVDRAATIGMLFDMGFPRDVVVSVLSCTGAPAEADVHDELRARLGRVRDEMGDRIARLRDTQRRLDDFLAGRPADGDLTSARAGATTG